MNHRHRQKWGIIGDGQLARMLTLDAYAMGIRPVLLTNDANSSAGQVCPLQVRGSVHSKTDLHALLSQVDGAIIESEFVNCDALEATGLGHKLSPSLASIRVLQNKLEQKRLLQKLQISTSPLHEQKEITSLWLDRLLNDHSTPVVLKFATLGYDGKGVCVLNGIPNDRERAEQFCALASERRIEIYAEDRVEYTAEAAMIAVRSVNGEFTTYPLVLSEQQNGICNLVTGPATSLGIDKGLETLARKWCETIALELDLVGTFAVEFFLTKGGSLLVNEIAPRVHNSGHYTQNAGTTSQFSNHWRAVTGLPLGTTEINGFFAMQNILGPSGILSKENAPLPAASPNTFVHWYGKAGISPGRKLGHINTASKTAAQHKKTLEELSATLDQWRTDTTVKIPPTTMELPG